MATQGRQKTQPKRLRALRLYDQMRTILQEFQPTAMTLRQLFYQLVARQIVENTPRQLQGRRARAAECAARRRVSVAMD